MSQGSNVPTSFILIHFKGRRPTLPNWHGWTTAPTEPDEWPRHGASRPIWHGPTSDVERILDSLRKHGQFRALSDDVSFEDFDALGWLSNVRRRNLAQIEQYLRDDEDEDSEIEALARIAAVVASDATGALAEERRAASQPPAHNQGSGREIIHDLAAEIASLDFEQTRDRFISRCSTLLERIASADARVALCGHAQLETELAWLSARLGFHSIPMQTRHETDENDILNVVCRFNTPLSGMPIELAVAGCVYHGDEMVRQLIPLSVSDRTSICQRLREWIAEAKLVQASSFRADALPAELDKATQSLLHDFMLLHPEALDLDDEIAKAIAAERVHDLPRPEIIAVLDAGEGAPGYALAQFISLAATLLGDCDDAIREAGAGSTGFQQFQLNHRLAVAGLAQRNAIAEWCALAAIEGERVGYSALRADLQPVMTAVDALLANTENGASDSLQKAADALAAALQTAQVAAWPALMNAIAASDADKASAEIEVKAFTAAWYKEATEEALYPDLLKRARVDGRIPGAEQRNGTLWYYPIESVVRAWPQYETAIRAKAAG